MKRSPLRGEPALTHSTEQTGDVQSFAICPENYDPAALKAMRSMVREPLMGYQLAVLDRAPDAIEFAVLRADGTALTNNRAVQSGRNISLHTSILQPMPPAEAGMVADIEQCAALMLFERGSDE